VASCSSWAPGRGSVTPGQVAVLYDRDAWSEVANRLGDGWDPERCRSRSLPVTRRLLAVFLVLLGSAFAR
jgi:hypothetical protein